MVDGGWGVLQDPNMIWVGHHLGFGAGGLAASPDRSRRPSGLRNVRMEVFRVHRENLLINYRKKVAGRTQGHVLRAASYSNRHSYRPLLL